MNWFTENKIFSSLLSLIALGVLALAFLTFTGSSKYSEAQAAYQAGVEKLTGLRGLAPYRNAENLAKIQEQVAHYKGITDSIHADLIKNQGEIASMEPAAFQGRLRESVSKAIEHASQRGVELPEKFYLGFEKYENELPRNDITGLLNWQLTAIDAVVNRLIDLKVTKVSEIIRPPLPGENNPEAAAKETPLLRKYPFEVVFQGYPSNVQSILNDLVNFPQFTIARAIRIENEQLQSPARSGALVAPTGESAPAVPAEATMDKIIIGKEKVTASIIIDLVQFTPKQISKK